MENNSDIFSDPPFPNQAVPAAHVALYSNPTVFAKILDSILDSVVGFDRQGTIFLWNRGSEKIFGYTSEEAVGAHISMVFPENIFSLLGADIAFGSEDFSKHELEVVFKRKDGTAIYAEFSFSPLFDFKGKEPVGILAYAKDITQRKRIEDTLRSVAETVSAKTGQSFFDSLIEQVQLVLDVDCVYLAAYDQKHQSLRSLAARTREQQIENFSLSLRDVSFGDALIEEPFVVLDCTKIALPECDLFGYPSFRSYHSVGLRSSSGQLLGLLIALDSKPLKEERLTNYILRIFSIRAASELEQRIVALELTNSKRQAEQASQAKNQFLANISHEIRTPINGIMGASELALTVPLSDEAKEYLEIINTSAESLLATVNVILDFSAIESGAIELDASVFFLQEILDRIVGPLNIPAGKRQIRIEQVIDEDTPKAVYGDARRLIQAVCNVLDNAIKFSPDSSVVTLYVSSQRGPFGRPILQFAVQDRGIGISQEEQKIIFNSFEQADNSYSRQFSGTGLGLAISSRLVRLMGGEIELSSSPGEGTLVTIRFPLHHPTAIQLAEREEKDRPFNPGKERGSCVGSILLVEDNRANQTVTKRLLELDGFSVIVAENAQQAVSQAVQGTFDVIIMDVQLPDSDGYWVTQEIRKLEHTRGGHTPIVALTAQATSLDEARCLEAGMDYYLSKPVKQSSLKDVVDKCLSIELETRL